MKASRFLLWGNNAEDVMADGYNYQMVRLIIVASDIVVFGSVMNILRSANVTFGTYVQAMIITFVIAYFLTTLITHRPRFMAYKFLSPVRDKDVKCDIICANPEELYEILYGELKVKLKKGDSVAHYVAVINNTCKMSQIYPYRVFDRLMKLSNEPKEGSVKIYVYSVRRKKNKPSALVHISLRDEILAIGEELLTAAKACSVSATNHIKGELIEVAEEPTRCNNEEIERAEAEKIARQQAELNEEQSIDDDVIEVNSYEEIESSTDDTAQAIETKVNKEEDENKELIGAGK